MVLHGEGQKASYHDHEIQVFKYAYTHMLNCQRNKEKMASFVEAVSEKLIRLNTSEGLIMYH